MLNLHQSIKVPTVIISLILSNLLLAAPNEPVQLNTNANVERFSISTDNQYVVFNEFDDINNLQRYTTKIDGQSNPIRVGSNVNETSNGQQFWIHPFNSRIINRLDNPFTNDRDFLSVSIDGQDSVLLRPAPPITGDVSSISTSGDNNLIAFIINSGGGVYSAPNDGSTQAINLSNAIDPTGNVDAGTIRITQNGSAVVFDAELDTINQQALFIVPINGSASPTRLTPLNDTVVNNFIISNDLTQIVYVEELGSENEIGFQQQLFSVALDGSSDPIPLTGIVNGEFSDIDFKISSDSQQVVYVTRNQTLNQAQLFSAPINGSSNPVLVNESIEIHQFEITNNNENIIYSIEQPIQPVPNPIFVPVIYSSSLTPTNSEEPLLLSFFSPTLSFLLLNIDIDFIVSQNSDFVFFTQVFNNQFIGNDLLRVSINNPFDDFVMLNNPPSENISGSFMSESVTGFELSNDETFIIYNFQPNFFTTTAVDFPSDIDIDSFPSSLLSKVSIDGSNNQSLDSNNENVFGFDISDNDEFVVFTAGLADSFTNLYSLNLDETEPLCFPIKDKSGNFVTICL